MAPTSHIVVDITTSFALSITPGTSHSWFFDSGFCNRMTFDANMFSSKTGLAKTFVVHTVDNSKLHVSHIGDISGANYLSLTHFCSLNSH